MLLFLPYQFSLGQSRRHDNECACEDLVNDLEDNGIACVHDNDTGNKRDTVGRSHNDLKRNNLPLLLSENGISDQKRDADSGNNDVNGKSDLLKEKQNDTDHRKNGRENKVFFIKSPFLYIFSYSLLCTPQTASTSPFRVAP